MKAIKATHLEDLFLYFPKCCWKLSKYTGSYAFCFTVRKWRHGDTKDITQKTLSELQN